MKAFYEAPEVERIDFAAMEAIAEVDRDEGIRTSEDRPDWAEDEE